MNHSADVVIVGAGIVGAACAFELAKSGLRPVILDKYFVAYGATSASMGHIVVMDDSPAQFALTRYSQILWAELEPEQPANVEHEKCGTLWIATDGEELLEVQRKHTYFRARNVRAEILDSQALHEAEPNLWTPMVGALRIPDDSVLYPPAATAFFIERACALGAKIYTGKGVASIGKGEARLEDGTTFHAKFIVNAAGQFAPELSPGISIKPRKGHLVITDRYPGFIRHQLVELGYLKSAHSTTDDSVAFNLQPRKTGQLLIGSSRQYSANSSEVDSQIVAQMLKRAFEYVPALAQLSAIRTWTGHRPATPDKLPLIGPFPDDPTVLIAAGHEGLGITTSLATGRLIADQILNRETEIPVEPYLPSRQWTSAALSETHA